jgi:membrane-associated phospholipid phosphatase
MDATTEGIEQRRSKGHAHPEQRRRPSGEPPALPHELGRSGKFFLLMVLYFILVITGFLLFPTLRGVFERWDHIRTMWITDLRSPGLTRLMLVVNGLAASWTIRVLRYGVFIGLIVFRRWRHLFVFLGAIILTEIVAYNSSSIIARPRPLGVPILAGWQGYSMPSRPMAGLAVSAVGATYALIVAGRSRSIAKWVIGVALVALGFARVYLGVDHSTDVVAGAVFGIAVGVASFRWFAPNDLFPVSYQRGKAAHLDVGGRRGEAIVAAIRDQLGLAVLGVKPVGLEGSGGSTPLRIKIEATHEEPERYVFAKLYAKSHVRADRWYKLGRTILYGALEDEKPFQSVAGSSSTRTTRSACCTSSGSRAPAVRDRRDHPGARVHDRDGVLRWRGRDRRRRHRRRRDRPGARHGAKMWDEGLAHRDVKPANLMVRDGELKVIDVFFVQVRPSPWRQAVDLANMMLVLALRSDAERVYAHALTYFSEDEIAEAFAAARGVASPTQLRNNLKQDGRDLLAEFRRMAPEREQVSIQRWSYGGVLLTIGVLFAAFLALGLVVSNWNAFA